MVEHGTHAREQMEPGVHPRLGRALEETRGAAQPPRTDRWRLTAEEHVREKKRRASGVDRSSGLDEGAERPLEGVGRLVRLSRPPRGLAHLLEVVCRQATVAVGRRKCLQPLRPGMALDGVPA
jgi:hypothetical protein